MFTVTTELAFRKKLWEVENFVLLLNGVRVENIEQHEGVGDYYAVETANDVIMHLENTHSLEFVGGFDFDQLTRFVGAINNE